MPWSKREEKKGSEDWCLWYNTGAWEISPHLRSLPDEHFTKMIFTKIFKKGLIFFCCYSYPKRKIFKLQKMLRNEIAILCWALLYYINKNKISSHLWFADWNPLLQEVIYSSAKKLTDEWEVSSHSVFHIWFKSGSPVDPIWPITL